MLSRADMTQHVVKGQVGLEHAVVVQRRRTATAHEVVRIDESNGGLVAAHEVGLVVALRRPSRDLGDVSLICSFLSSSASGTACDISPTGGCMRNFAVWRAVWISTLGFLAPKPEGEPGIRKKSLYTR